MIEENRKWPILQFLHGEVSFCHRVRQIAEFSGHSTLVPPGVEIKLHDFSLYPPGSNTWHSWSTIATTGSLDFSHVGARNELIKLILVPASNSEWATPAMDVALRPSPNFAKTVNAVRAALGDSASSPRFIETIAGRGYRFIAGLQPHLATSKKIESVAVLPLATDSSEPDLDFVGNQITSGIINALSSKAGVHVLAHSTVKHYKPQAERPKAIGKALDVDAVLIGELSLHQTDLLLNVEFVDANDGTQLWGAHLREHWGAEIDAAQRLIKEVLYRLLPVLIPSPKKIMPISSKPRALPIRKVSGNRN